MAAKFEIYTDARGEFRFRLKAGNGEIVATGEGYKSKDGVLKGVDAVKRAAADAEVDDKTGDKANA
ncbi:YegP family protein [Actinophytocola sediminis]